ncbi:MAG: TIGR02391 family protein [Limnochordia bacterium]|jgi:hypothetical protein
MQTLYDIIVAYQDLYDKALDLYYVFEDADVPELKQRLGELNRLVEGFLSIAGLEWSDCGNLGRHLHFMAYYLDRNDKAASYADAKDIVFSDLPTGLRKLIKDNPEESHLDERLNASVMPLVRGGYYDSAIRKAFVVLTDRLRRSFGPDDALDGELLVNAVFGGKGTVDISLDDATKQAYRNLFSGFYGVYRNRYAHGDPDTSLAEVKAVIEMTNNLLREIEHIASRPVSSQA